MTSPGLYIFLSLNPGSRPLFLSEAHQSVHDVSVGREKDVEQEERKYTALAETMFNGEPTRAPAAVEPHAYPYAIVKLTDDLNRLYIPKECSID